jgi:DNA-binding NtrC family response regulator
MAPLEVVVIDDEIEICEIITKVLGRQNLESKHFTNPVEALSFCLEHRPMLILCDISMPGMTGLEFLEEIKKASLPTAFVMITAHFEKEKIITAMRLGAIDYVMKPFNVSKLSEDVAVWLELGKRIQKLSMDFTDDPLHERNAKMINLYQVLNQKRRSEK